MYSYYTVDDVLQTASCFGQSVKQTWAELDERCKMVENLYIDKLKKNCKYQELKNAAQKIIETECKKQDYVKLCVEQNRIYIQGLRENVAKLKEVKQEKEKQLLRLERDVEKVRSKIQSRLDAREEINTKKDIILTYKLLTNTSFVYTTNKVTGIVTKNPPKSFSFNPEELSQEEITEKLWQLVLEV